MTKKIGLKICMGMLDLGHTIFDIILDDLILPGLTFPSHIDFSMEEGLMHTEGLVCNGGKEVDLVFPLYQILHELFCNLSVHIGHFISVRNVRRRTILD